MNTADEVRRAWWRGYWRTREHQLLLQEHFFVPVAKLAAEKMRELYPVDEPVNGAGQST